jgi:hypothetical protein
MGSSAAGHGSRRWCCFSAVTNGSGHPRGASTPTTSTSPASWTRGGYPPRIRSAVESRFPHLPEAERASLTKRIHEANIVTACQFCNSTTSRDRAPFTMEDVIAALPDDPEEALPVAAEKLQAVLEVKRQTVRWKLRSVNRGFRESIRPALLARRRQEPALRKARDLSGLDVPDTAPFEGGLSEEG